MMKKPTQRLLAVAILFGASTASAGAPRTLPSGAPACGNTNTKSPSNCQRAERELEAARRELTAALAEEREYARKGITPPTQLVNAGTRTTALVTRLELARARLANAEQTMKRDADYGALNLMNPDLQKRKP
ncbi:MAG: hypothetical protein ACKV2T_26220 [Kofleriaceae bacterium]